MKKRIMIGKTYWGLMFLFLIVGVWDYTFQVAIPSVTGYLLSKQGKLPIHYYSQPWEYEADQLGGVYRGVPLVSITYWDLLKMF